MNMYSLLMEMNMEPYVLKMFRFDILELMKIY